MSGALCRNGFSPTGKVGFPSAWCYSSLGDSLPGRQPDTTACCVRRLPGQVVTLAFGVKHTQKEYYALRMISCNLHRNIGFGGRRARGGVLRCAGLG